jgi:NAD(P)-dependent dehydrogenase (short-subunit alcohol dehydrogenase family)
VENKGENDMDNLTNKVVLVTGGGRGLGEAVCRVLADAGANVVCADIREDLAAAAAGAIQAAGKTAMPLRLDVGSETDTRAAVERVIGRFGRLDALINNAGVDVTLPVDEISPDDWDRVISVNLRGPFLMSRAVLGVMKPRRTGHIVNITSTAAKRAWANASAYHASKWGLLGFSHALHVEARQHNIKVTAVVSGGMRTPFLLDRFPDIDTSTLQDPANVAHTIRFLLTQPDETVIPEIMVLPLRETSWP